ncbi:unnamed protein product [Meloidogyne enterolobii]|uniref:Uncharacterized protein n=1 Tax=Meloidogyne enterolobii TaxID=390850 RepID=A0ACB0ZLI7_MELEN
MSVPIILLREGTQTKQGRGQILSNISACCAVADSVRTTLGPRGLDKLLVDRKGLDRFFELIFSRRRGGGVA